MRYFFLLFWLGLASIVRADSALIDGEIGTLPVGDWRLRPVASTHKLTARQKGVLEPFAPTPVQLLAARGEWECFQIVIAAGNRPLRDIRLSATMLATHLARFLPAKSLHFYRENFVRVEHPSGNRRLEKLWWPDALIPLEAQPIPDIAVGCSEVLWCAVQVPSDAAVGEYFGSIDFQTDRGEKSLAITLDVSSVAMPPPTLRANAALYYDVLRDWYLKANRAFSDADWAMQKKRYYDFLLDYRLNAYDLPVDWNDPVADDYLHDAKVLSVRLPPLDRPDFAAAIARLKVSGTIAKAYYYWLDEPSPDRYAEVRSVTEKLHAIDARLRHCVTVHPNAALQNAVDIWCPDIGDATGLGYLDLKVLSAQRKAGRETWWYTMVEPKYPYPTWLLDDDAVAVRLYGRLMAQAGITGFVYSMVHGWGPHPLEDLRSFADTNGDGTLLYPAELVGGVGPMPSIRLMLLRDAIEDYELLRAAPKAFQTRWISLSDEEENVLQLAQRDRSENETQRWRRELLDQTAPQAKFLRSTFSLAAPRTARAIPIKSNARIDGQLQSGEWTNQELAQGSLQTIPDLVRVKFQRFAGDEMKWPQTSWYLARDSKYFMVGARARSNSAADWFAIEIAPNDTVQKWRFVVTAGGKNVVEKYTREGRFQVSGLDWQGASYRAADFTDYEIKIPISILEGAPSFRINALRRLSDANGTRILLRAAPDANDARRMPQVFLSLRNPQPIGAKSKKHQSQRSS